MTLNDLNSGCPKSQLRLLITHPTSDLGYISARLGFEPRGISTAGMPRSTPKCRPLPGFYEDSRWSRSFAVSDKGQFSSQVEEFLEILEEHALMFRELVQTGGSVQVIINILGLGNIGDTISWTTLDRLAKLNVDLGFEVFP